ncbi:MAG: single-stranded-DNA-specific exonuclease RecJ [Gammaproteobacteria bacterium]
MAPAPHSAGVTVLTRRPIRRRSGGDASRLGGLHPLLARIYAGRGVARPEDCDTALGGLLPVGGLSGVEAAAGLVKSHLDRGQRILVIGDFDADGATSTALLVRVLGGLGADVGYMVPDRARHGYGLSPGLVEEALQREPALIVTVDSGINCHPGIEMARRHGVRVLVTDHHLPGEALPPADAILNPNLPDSGFASPHLAGVGVAFYLAAAVLRAAGGDPRQAAGHLDLVALGTVADLVRLDRNNRILVSQGLRRIRSGAGVPGVTALLTAGGRDPGAAVAADLAFAAGPRLNAAGRLDDMSLGIECLLADDPGRAAELASALGSLNEERKQLEGQMQEEALAAVKDLAPSAGKLPPVLCVYRQGWHQGVVGLVASRLKERFHRPVVAFADDGEGGLKGSARSVPGLHIRDLLAAVDARRPGLVSRFGGHAMAAGLTLAPGALKAFAQALQEESARWVDDADFSGTIWSDGELSDEEFSLETAELLRGAGPWGQGFPEPVFDGRFQLLDARVVGSHHLKMRLRPAAGRRIVDAIAFRQADRLAGPRPGEVHCAYRLDVNDYGGIRSPQLVVEYFEAV